MSNRTIEEGSFWDRVLDMFAQSIIIQSTITLLLIGSLCALWVFAAVNRIAVEQVLPEELLNVTLLVLGFWFGQKTQLSGQRQASDVANRIAQESARVAAVTALECAKEQISDQGRTVRS